MFQQRYVPFGVALCAALGVHAFVLFYVVQPRVIVMEDQPIQIDLVPQVAPPEALKQSAQKEEVKQTQQVQSAVIAKPHHVDEMDDVNKVMVQENVAQPMQTLPKEESESVQKPEQEQVHIVSKPIQQRILAAITYPKQAMRRGWEGTAKFSLDVQQQAIRNVTLLVSTGYKTLDYAAKKGIDSIAILPLSDGKYTLPITFQLQ